MDFHSERCEFIKQNVTFLQRNSNSRYLINARCGKKKMAPKESYACKEGKEANLIKIPLLHKYIIFSEFEFIPVSFHKVSI